MSESVEVSFLALFQGSISCAHTSYWHLFLYHIGDSSHTTCGASAQSPQSGWGVLYDIIQGTEEWKGAETKFIQEVGTFWCIHFNIDAHTDTSHQRPVPHLETITLMFDLTCCTKWTLPTFLCVCCRGGGDPDTVAVGKWCVISQREHDSSRLK